MVFLDAMPTSIESSVLGKDQQESKKVTATTALGTDDSVAIYVSLQMFNKGAPGATLAERRLRASGAVVALRRSDRAVMSA